MLNVPVVWLVETTPSAASLTVFTVIEDPATEARLHVRTLLELFATRTALPAVPLVAASA